MAEIANLGFRADTSELADAKAELHAIAPAAKKAEKAADDLGKAFGGAAAGAARMSSATDKAAASEGRFEAAASGATAATNSEAAAMNAASGAIERKAGWISRLISRLRGVGPASSSAAAGVRNVTQAANDNAGAMRANVGNIAAQFQDIGVTAQMGMSPMMIALQQGTQLSAVFAQSGQSAFKTIAMAIGQVLSPVSLLTIGLVGLLAAGVQAVDWIKLLKGVLNDLADILPTIAPYVLGIGAAFALWNLPAIISGVVGLTKAMWGLVASMLAALGIPGAIILGFAAIIAAANIWRDDLTKMIGIDIVGVVKKAVNFIIGGFVGGYKAIVATWDKIPGALGDATYEAVNFVLRGIQLLINNSIDQINKLIRAAKTVGLLPIFSPEMSRIGDLSIGNPYAGQAKAWNEEANAIIAKEQGKDWVGNFVDGAMSLGKWAADKLRGLAAGLGSDGKKDKDKKDKKAGKTDAEREAEAFAKLVTGAENYVRAKQAEEKALGLTALAAAELKHRTDLINQATQQGIPITDARKKKIEELAAAMAKADMSFENAKAFKEATEAAKKRQQDLNDELKMVGMTVEETIRYRNEVIWLREEKEKLKNATPAQVKALEEYARGMSQTEIAIERARKQAELAREALDFAKDATRGFIDDLKTGLVQGENIFKTFGNAVLNVLDKIIDRMLDMALDQLFSPQGGGGGFFGDIMGSLFSVFGGSGLGDGVRSAASYTSSDFGFDFSFAKGGAFTNAIYRKPTMFSFANGTALGEMGEAGPEAVMPLKRGPDGSLGVQMYNDMQSSGAAANAMRLELVVRAEEGKMFKPTVEAIAEEKSVQVTKAGIAQYDQTMPQRMLQISNDDRAR